MEMNFCRRCGQPLQNTHDHVYHCPSGHIIYANGSPAIGIFFVSTDNQQVLLATRAHEPHKGMLDALGGFLDSAESFEDAAIRELEEELGLQPEDYEPFTYLTSGFDDYPYKGESIPFASVLYWTRLRSDKPLRPADDVAEVEWYNLATVDIDQLHSEDIRIGVRELQNKFLTK